MNYLTGRLPVTATGMLTTSNGVGRFELESARVSSIPVPKMLLQGIVSYYSRTPDNPSGISLDDPFALPAPHNKTSNLAEGAGRIIAQIINYDSTEGYLPLNLGKGDTVYWAVDSIVPVNRESPGGAPSSSRPRRCAPGETPSRQSVLSHSRSMATTLLRRQPRDGSWTRRITPAKARRGERPSDNQDDRDDDLGQLQIGSVLPVKPNQRRAA